MLMLFLYNFLFQITYELESFIEYVGKLPGRQSKSMAIQAHYVGYQIRDDCVLRFDDAAVHKVDLQEEYNVNLVFYRRSDIPPHAWRTYTDSIPVLTRPVYLDMPRPKLKLHKIDANISNESGISATAKVDTSSSNISATSKDSKSSSDKSSFADKLKYRPALITHEETRRHRRTSHKPQRQGSRAQPGRYTKDSVQYFPDTDSSLEGESDTPSNPPTEDEYRPPDDTKGLLLIYVQFYGCVLY